MSLTSSYVQVYGQLPNLFDEIAKGQAPEQFTVQHLKDLGFASSNHRAFIPLLKELGFLSDDGKPTHRYHEYRNRAQSRQIMAQAIREAYGDIFVLRSRPTEEDRPLIEGKFKSAHNTTERMAQYMANTFFALLDLADLDTSKPPAPPDEENDDVALPPALTPPPVPAPNALPPAPPIATRSTTLHYNIQVHLPPTKDVEVYNAIFKALKEHLVD